MNGKRAERRELRSLWCNLSWTIRSVANSSLLPDDQLIVPLWKIYYKNQKPSADAPFPVHLPLSHVLSIVTDSFTSATERHIEVGDGLEIYLILAKGKTLSGLGLESVRGMSEITSTSEDSDGSASEGETFSEGERVFVIRRDLKKD